MSTQNDLINYQNVIKEANSLINEQIKLWGGVVSSIQQVGKVTPSSFVNAQKQVNETLQKSVEIQTKLDAVETKRKATTQQILTTGTSLYNQQQKEIAQQERKRIALDRATAKALEQSRAYNRLQTSWRNAQKALADSIVTDGMKAKSTQRLQREFNDLDRRIKQVDATTKNYSKNVGNYQSAFNGLGGLTSQLAGALGWAGAIGTSVALGKSIYDTTKQLDVLNKSMELGSKDTQAYASNIDFLNRVTENYGLELITTSQAYNKFYIASKNKLALEDIQLIFDKVSKSASLMGMSVYEQEGIFKALEQMMSKGTVQAEELRGQLGDRLPGAFEIMANAMGVSTEKLGDMMKNGEVMASEVLPKFAVELEKAFGADKVDKVNNLTAAENRLKNEWTSLVQEMSGSEGTLTGFFSTIINWFARMLDGLRNLIVLYGAWLDISVKLPVLLHTLAQSLLGFSEVAEKAFKFDFTGAYDAMKKNFNGMKAVAKAGYNDIIKTVSDAGKKINKENEKFNNINGWGSSDFLKDNTTKTETEAERNKRLAAEKKAREEAEKLRLKDLETDYKIAEQRIKNEIEVTDNFEEQMLKKYELANLWYSYELSKAKGNAKEIILLTEQMTSRMISLNEEEKKHAIKSSDEKAKAEAEAIKKRLEEAKKLRDYLTQMRESQGNISQTNIMTDIESLGSNRGTEYWDLQTKLLEDYYKTERDLAEGNALKLAEIDAKYTLDSIKLQNDRKNAFKQSMTEMYSSALGDMGAGSLAQFFNGQFEEIWAGAETLQEKMASVMMAIGDIASDVFDAMSERQNAYFQQQFANLETEKDLALQFAGENTAGREAIEKQYDEKKRELQKQQAKQQKQMALIQATINVATGVTSALAQAPPYSFILAALVGVLGAVQIANIASTPLPQFYTGTSNAPEGLALTQERGAEMITDKNGNIKTLGNNKGAQLTYLNKGDKVFTADETTQKLNELLISSGVSPIVNVSGGSGLTEEQMRNIMQDTLAKQPKNSITFDENGIKAFTSKENRRTILKNRNVRI